MKSQSKASNRHRGVVAATGVGTGVAALVLIFSGAAGAVGVDAVTVEGHDANPALSAVASASGADALYLAQTTTPTLPQPHEEEDAQHQQDLKDQQHMLDEQDQHMKLQHTSGQDDEEQHQLQQPAPTQ